MSLQPLEFLLRHTLACGAGPRIKTKWPYRLRIFSAAPGPLTMLCAHHARRVLRLLGGKGWDSEKATITTNSGD